MFCLPWKPLSETFINWAYDAVVSSLPEFGSAELNIAWVPFFGQSMYAQVSDIFQQMFFGDFGMSQYLHFENVLVLGLLLLSNVKPFSFLPAVSQAIHDTLTAMHLAKHLIMTVICLLPY